MSKGDEWNYRDWNLETYEDSKDGSDCWSTDYWSRADARVCGTVSHRRKRESMQLAKTAIDRYEADAACQ